MPVTFTLAGMKTQGVIPQSPTAGAGFPAGTPVHTRDGLKAIEQLAPGDWVLSRADSGEGRREYKRVTNTLMHADREVRLLYIGGKKDANAPEISHKLVVTSELLFWVNGKSWKEAATLKLAWPRRMMLEFLTDDYSAVAGNVRLYATEDPQVAWVPLSSQAVDLGCVGSLLNVAGMTITQHSVAIPFESVRTSLRAKAEHRYRTTVYNIEVEDFRTYFVGAFGAWVHS